MVSAAGEYLSDAGRQIQIADLIDEVTDGERVNVYAEDSLLYGIREYNANICLVTEGELGTSITLLQKMIQMPAAI